MSSAGKKNRTGTNFRKRRTGTNLLPVVRGAIGVIEREGKVLIQQRKRGAHLEGLWEFPGGKRRPGESAAACLRREIKEELGIIVRVGASLGQLRYDYPERRVRLGVFRCQIIRGKPKPLGSAAIRWVARDRLARHPFPPANQPLLRLLNPSVCPQC